MKKYVWHFIVMTIVMSFFLTGCDKKTDVSTEGNRISSGQESTQETTTEAATEEAAEEENSEEEEYILPDSDKKRVTNSDLKSLSSRELQLARNEIYARHGRKFDTSWIRSYFEDKSWYKGTIDPEDFDEDEILDSIEKYNAKFIARYEENGSGSSSSSSSGSGSSSSGSSSSSSSSGSGSSSYRGGSSSSGKGSSSSICSFCGGLGHCKYCLTGSCSMCKGMRTQRCIGCRGTGRCGPCGGNGYTYKGTGIMFRKSTCTSCRGTGRCGTCSGLGKTSCSYCRGTGNCNYCRGNYQCSYCGGTGIKY